MAASADPSPPGLWPGAPRPHRALRLAVLFLAALALVVAAAITHRVADAVRGSPVRGLATGAAGAPAPDLSDPFFAEQLSALAPVSIAPGHEVQVLTDGGVFDALLADLSGARRSITFATYFCEPGRLAERFAVALAERARAGVRVLFLVDDFGCSAVLRQVSPTLVAAGVEVALLRPTHWLKLDRAQHRNHIRAVVIDGSVGYTGGFGLGDEWRGEDGTPWRDTSARFVGPAVPTLQAAFLAGWAEATGTLLGGPDFFPAAPSPGGPAPAPAGSVRAGLLVSPPGLGSTPAERALALTLGGARRTLFLSNSYFVPTPLMLEQLEDAAARGVDVRLLLPGPLVDHPTTRWAGRAYYPRLLAAGVRIWEYRVTMLHAKTLVADGVWSWIGTMNLDNRSMRLNDEDALLIEDEGTASTLEQLFAADLQHAQEITRERYASSPGWTRIRDRLIRGIEPLL